MNSTVALVLICMIGLLWSFSAAAGQKIRMYEVNKKQQQRKIVIGGAVEKAGCHDLLWAKDIYRVAQIGYAWCSVYSQEGCAENSLVPAYWSDGEYRKYDIDGTRPQPKLYPGTKWLIASEGKKIKSWHCEPE